MEFGTTILTRGAAATREGCLAMAEKAESLGFAYVSVNDHVVVPGGIASRYPYSEEGRWAGSAAGECLEQLATVAFIAGATRRVRLLTSVMVVPHRQPVLAAKMLATIDVLSGGRLTVGCGAGWLAEEFAALGTPPFAERGAATDEYLQAFRTLWTEDAPRFEGRYVRFADLAFAPKPVQKPHPPLWIGGESPAALRRAARLGDGWYPASNNPRHRLDTPARLAAGIGALRREAEATGRDPATIDLAWLVLWPVAWSSQTLADGGRRPFTGSAADLAADVAAAAAAGVRHLSLTFQAADLGETLERMQRFAEEVMPLVQ
jgi:probable F420-dependent oxidoreductase